MKLKDLDDITFYSRCQCPNIENIVSYSFRELCVFGVPECHRCGKEYTYDEDQEVWSC